MYFYEPSAGHGLRHDPFNSIVGPSGGAGEHFEIAPDDLFRMTRPRLEGTSTPDHTAATAMPSFAAAYTDAEIAAVANYATFHFGGKQGQVTVKDVADARP